MSLSLSSSKKQKLITLLETTKITDRLVHTPFSIKILYHPLLFQIYSLCKALPPEPADTAVTCKGLKGCGVGGSRLLCVLWLFMRLCLWRVVGVQWPTYLVSLDTFTWLTLIYRLTSLFLPGLVGFKLLLYYTVMVCIYIGRGNLDTRPLQ